MDCMEAMTTVMSMRDGHRFSRKPSLSSLRFPTCGMDGVLGFRRSLLCVSRREAACALGVRSGGCCAGTWGGSASEELWKYACGTRSIGLRAGKWSFVRGERLCASMHRRQGPPARARVPPSARPPAGLPWAGRANERAAAAGRRAGRERAPGSADGCAGGAARSFGAGVAGWGRCSRWPASAAGTRGGGRRGRRPGLGCAGDSVAAAATAAGGRGSAAARGARRARPASGGGGGTGTAAAAAGARAPRAHHGRPGRARLPGGAVGPGLQQRAQHRLARARLRGRPCGRGAPAQPGVERGALPRGQEETWGHVTRWASPPRSRAPRLRPQLLPGHPRRAPQRPPPRPTADLVPGSPSPRSLRTRGEWRCSGTLHPRTSLRSPGTGNPVLIRRRQRSRRPGVHRRAQVASCTLAMPALARAPGLCHPDPRRPHRPCGILAPLAGSFEP